jgi:signal peptidase I
MGTLILRWFLSKKIRQAVDMGRQVRKLISAQRDWLSPEEIQEISKAARELRSAVAAQNGLEGIEKRMQNLEKVANENLKPYPSASLRENIEVFLVTGAVVLALRTFFFQPMAIPSGSAQPTLWGITSEDLRGRPDVKTPRRLERLFQSCWAGAHYFSAVAKTDGILSIEPTTKFLNLINRQTLRVGDQAYPFYFTPDPPDAQQDLASRAGLRPGQRIRKGEEFIKLKVVSGDHLFVNRLVYNFRTPRRGDIIVFYSDHIPGLIEETHYIKRLIAQGGEHVRIGNDRHVYINGEQLDASTPGFENVYSFDPDQPPERDHYSGHVNNVVAARYAGGNLSPLFQDETTERVVRPNHYLAFGDNTMNSKDGRDWGDFPREFVMGKASFVFWPIGDRDQAPSRFGWGYR